MKSDKIHRFVYVEDIIQANIKACNLKSGLQCRHRKGKNFEDIVDIYKRLKVDNGKSILIIRLLINFTEANMERPEEFLGYEPQFSLEDGINLIFLKL